MELRILGPLEALANGRQVAIGRGKPQALLAMLALHRGEVVSTDAIVDGLWGERPPGTAAKSVQVYVSRLRKALGDGIIVTRPPGYLLVIDPEQLDLARFERLVEVARQLPPPEAATSLRDALALWRGPPLADVDGAFADAEIARLEELRLAAVEERIGADLALGRSAQVIAELESLVRTHPYRERLRGQLMLALYRSGRQADALDVYRETRTTMSEELGLEPGDDLRDLERRILAHDPTLVDTQEAPSEEAPLRRKRRRRSILAVIGVLLLAGAGATVGIVELASDGESSPVVAPPNSIAVIDPVQNAVVDAIPLGERPTRIATHGDDVWVLHPDRATVSHVSGSERQLVGTVGVGGAPSGLAADERGVWVSDARSGRVALIERERLTEAAVVKARRRPLSGYSDAGLLALGFDSLWYASGERTISRIDPRTARVTARIRPVSTGESNGGIGIGAGSVWVAGPVQGSPLTRIDPVRNRVLARIAIPKFRSSGITVGRDVWVSDAGGDQVWRVDPLRNVAVGTAHVGAAPVGVAFGHGSIWVANAGDGTVSRIDPVTGRVVRTITVGGSPNGLAVTDDAVWVTVA